MVEHPRFIKSAKQNTIGTGSGWGTEVALMAEPTVGKPETSGRFHCFDHRQTAAFGKSHCRLRFTAPQTILPYSPSCHHNWSFSNVDASNLTHAGFYSSLTSTDKARSPFTPSFSFSVRQALVLRQKRGQPPRHTAPCEGARFSTSIW